ncbi:MAG: acyl--CoA ligase family protein [Candidatus Korobacteraceae bacterium]
MKSVLTPLDFLARSATVYPSCTAAVDGDFRLTYSEFQQRVHAFAAALQRVGVAPGDRVAVLARNSLLGLEAHFAVPLIGAVLVMLNIRLQSAELATILNHSGAKILVGDDLVLPLVAIAGQMSRLERIVLNYEEFLRKGNSAVVPHEVGEDDVISINYTSGTTGNPKGVMYTHRGGYMNAIGEVVEHGLTSRSVYLWTLPMFHCNGWCFPWAVTAVGGRHVCLPEVNAERAVDLIEKEGVTHLCGAPVVVRTLTEHCSRRGIRFQSGLRMVTAAAPPPPAVIRAAEEIGIEITHVYGLTETYGPHSVCAWHSEWDCEPLEKRAQLKARQGVPYVVFGSDMRVVDEDMHDVPADASTIGEVVMRGNNVMLGYYNEPEATETAFRGGWFHSGDLAVMHPDGYIEIRDRAKDIIISGGENISSVEVERVLYEHPAVMEAAIVAQHDDKWGEVPHAYVLLKEDATVSAEELIEFCRSRLAHFKCPKAVHFGPLPKTSTGKIRKNVLRAQSRVAVAEGV